MIDLILRIVLAIATRTACDLGTPADYYAWVEEHPDYRVPLALETEDRGDYWLMEADGEYLLFKFAEPLAETMPSGASHGECARIVQND